MKQLSQREGFYHDVGQAMSMNNMHCFINIHTLEVEIHPGEDTLGFDESTATFTEAVNNPELYLPLETIPTHDSFRIMENFVDTVEDRLLQAQLISALRRKRPFANFKHIIDYSPLRQHWFDYRDSAYTKIAEEWFEENAGEELKERIRGLPDVHKGE